MADYRKTIELKDLSQTTNATTCFVTSTYNDTLTYTLANSSNDRQIYKDGVDMKYYDTLDKQPHNILININMCYVTNVLLESNNEDYGTVPFYVDLLDDNDYTFYTTYLFFIKPQQRIQDTRIILHNLIHFYLI